MFRVAAVAALLLASGCATLPAPPASDDWLPRREALQALDHWTLTGRIAVAAGDDGFSGGFEWAQAGGEAEVSLRGPMGGSAVRLHVTDDDLAVTLDDGTRYTGADARRFLDERIGSGRALPIRELRYWLVGVPAPQAPHEESQGDDHRLAGLSQSGWQIRYDRYETAGRLALPARMEMSTEGLRLRVAVSDWRLPP